jgi:hypothetical protein
MWDFYDLAKVLPDYNGFEARANTLFAPTIFGASLKVS